MELELPFTLSNIFRVFNYSREKSRLIAISCSLCANSYYIDLCVGKSGVPEPNREWGKHFASKEEYIKTVCRISPTNSAVQCCLFCFLRCFIRKYTLLSKSVAILAEWKEGALWPPS